MRTNLAALVERLIVEHGPMEIDVLRAQLRRVSPETPEADIDLLLTLDEELPSFPISHLPDGRVAWLSTLFRGRIFTHRLTEDEVADEALTVYPDLSPLVQLVDLDGIPLASGGTLALSDEPYAELPDPDAPEQFQLTPGTLEDYEPGDVIGVRVLAEGFGLEIVHDLNPVPADLAERAHRVLEVAAQLRKPTLVLDHDGIHDEPSPICALHAMVQQLCATLWSSSCAPMTQIYFSGHWHRSVRCLSRVTSTDTAITSYPPVLMRI